MSLEECLMDLNLFCHNKLLGYLDLNYSYGEINPLIQNLLREQNFITILVNLLLKMFPKFEHLKEISDFSNFSSESSKKNIVFSIKIPRFSIFSLKTRFFFKKTLKKTIDFFNKNLFFSLENELNSNEELKVEFIHKKLFISLKIYRLLSSLCTNNSENQQITSKYLPLFIMHSFFLPSAFHTILTIISNNEEFLLNLLDNKENSYDLSPFQKPRKTKTEENMIKTQVSIEHISSKNPKDQMKLIEGLKAEFEEKQKKSFINYIEFYNKDLNFDKKDQKKLSLPYNQDLINFFVNNSLNGILTKNSMKKTNFIKKNLFFFLNSVSSIGQTGVNSNQEIIYKILIQEFKTLDFILISIENDENKLVINIENNKKELEKFCKEKKRKKGKNKVKNGKNNEKNDKTDEKNDKNQEKNEEIELIVIKKEVSMSENVKFLKESLAGQLDFFSQMCNGRNYTWKSYLEKIISYNSLIKYLDSKLDFSNFHYFFYKSFFCFLDIKSKICKLLTKLYIDQEPRRIQTLPELCKIVNVSSDNAEEKASIEENLEGLDMEIIKRKMISLIKKIVKNL